LENQNTTGIQKQHDTPLTSPLNMTSSNPMPADEQQRIKGQAVGPADVGRVTIKPSDDFISDVGIITGCFCFNFLQSFIESFTFSTLDI